MAQPQKEKAEKIRDYAKDKDRREEKRRRDLAKKRGRFTEEEQDWE
jgi:hypothetical protein